MKKALRLSVLLPVITGLILSLSALLNINPNVFANGTVNWTGQGVTGGSLNSTDCSQQQNYLLWVFTVGGNSNVTSATLNLGGSGSGSYPMTKTGNEWKATTAFFNLNTLSASVAYTGSLGNGNPNLTISHGCPGTSPSPTPTPRVTPTPTPTPTPKVTPTPTPSVTPTPSISPSPTPNPCDEEDDDDDDYDNNHVTFWNLFRFDVQAHFGNDECPSPTPSPRPTPTPTPTPSVTPTPNPSPSTPPIGGGPSIGGNISTPQCPSDRPQKVDQVWFTDVKPGEVTVNWANKGDAWGFQIAYGPAQNNLIWGVEVDDPKATSFTLKNLPGGDLWVQVIAKSSKECGGPGSEPKVVGQVLGGQVLAATGNSQATIAFASGFALIVLGLWQAQRALKVSAK